MKSFLDKNTLETCAEKANIAENTAFFWRQKLNFFFNQSLNRIILKDTAESDETVYSDNVIGTKNANIIRKEK